VVNPEGFTSILTKSQCKRLVSKSDSSINALAKRSSNRMKIKSIIAALLSVIIVFTGIPMFATAVSEDDFYYYETQSYNEYLQNNKAQAASNDIALDLFGYESEPDKAKTTNIASQKAVQIEENGSINISFTVPRDGYYNLELDYYPVIVATSPIKFEFRIDGELPFSGASSITLKRIWKENTKQEKDSQGNQIRLPSVESPDWVTERVEDEAGLALEPYKFFFSAGEHTVTIAVFQNILALKGIRLVVPEILQSYEQISQYYKAQGYNKAKKGVLVEAENLSNKSDRSIVVTSDKTSPAVSPSGETLIRYNTVGGGSWKTVGEWIEWDVEIPQDGLYQIGLHCKQDLKEGSTSFRCLYIDGKIPFTEAKSLEFSYNSSWQNVTLGNGEESYLFYLAKGKHTLRLKATLGNYAEELARLDETLAELNKLYTDIVMVTGPNPDADRDYQFEKSIPDVIENMEKLSKALKEIEKSLDKLSGETGGSSTATVKRLYRSLDQMFKEPELISKKLGNFSNDITSLATWINTSREQPLQIDTICFDSPENPMKAAKGGFFSTVGFYIKQFLFSFVMNYANVGNRSVDYGKEIRVWIGTGRDQADIIRGFVNESFMPTHNIGVNVQLVDVGSLLPATLANTGPDVYLSISEEKPMDYALRHAVVNLKEFSDCDEVLKRFYPEALTSFYLDDGLYALPETMSYPMLFYRKDILTSLGIKKEDLTTWESLLQKVLPELDMNYFDFGVATGIKSFANFLYQNDGRFYSEDSTASTLDSAESIAAFELMTSMFTDYGMPKAYDFANRFRSGQMPLAIAEYTSFNQLSIFAPEINGLWDMMPIPGMVDEKGEIDNTAVATVTGSIILSDSQNLEESWKFLKWWSSSEIQSRYADELETIMGTGARYAAANIETMESINWDRSTKSALNEQLQNVVGMPYVAGSYYTTRSFDFAFRDVVFGGENLRESIVNAATEITNEITSKRKEFYSNEEGKK